jgi:hypothetical protein
MHRPPHHFIIANFTPLPFGEKIKSFMLPVSILSFRYLVLLTSRGLCVCVCVLAVGMVELFFAIV